VASCFLPFGVFEALSFVARLHLQGAFSVSRPFHPMIPILFPRLMPIFLKFSPSHPNMTEYVVSSTCVGVRPNSVVATPHTEHMLSEHMSGELQIFCSLCGYGGHTSQLICALTLWLVGLSQGSRVNLRSFLQREALDS
jgi:hypothetical protein